MAILPVSSVSFKNTTPANFTSKRGNDTEGNDFTPSKRRGTTDLAKMPVVVLLAMTPAMADAIEPKLPELENLPAAVIAETQTPETDAMTYILAPETQETQQSKAPFGYECLRHQQINYRYNFNTGGKSYSLVYTGSDDNKTATFVYIIPADSKGSKNNSDFPPEVVQLRYHNIGKDKEFCGAIIDEDVRDANTGKYRGTFRRELRLPDEAAQKIIDLLTNHSQFKNNTEINIKEVKFPNLLPPKLYE